jgi:hypothetical protein
VDVGLFYLIDAVKGKEISIFLQIWTRKYDVSWLSDFIFYPKPLYKSLHQSFFYSFITILPSESGVTLDFCTIFPYTLSFRHFTFKHLSRDYEKTTITAMYHGRWTWKCADPELERQIRCFPYGERSDIPRLQQVEQKAIGWQRNLGLGTYYVTLKLKNKCSPNTKQTWSRNTNWMMTATHCMMGAT